jgi:hypothetical protein
VPRFASPWIVAASLLLAAPHAAAEPTPAAGASPDAQEEVAGATARLRVETDPADAHVYARGPMPGRASDDVAGQCTGACTLALAPGAYRIEAGLTHSSLSVAPKPVTLGRGEVLDLRIKVRPNVVRDGIVLGSLGTSLACIVGFLAVGAADWPQFPEGMPRPTPITRTLMVGVGAGLLVGFGAMYLMKDPIVTTHP